MAADEKHTYEQGNSVKTTTDLNQELLLVLKRIVSIFIIIFKDRKYWIRLKNTIEHFNLPIDTWSIGNAAY